VCALYVEIFKHLRNLCEAVSLIVTAAFVSILLILWTGKYQIILSEFVQTEQNFQLDLAEVWC